MKLNFPFVSGKCWFGGNSGTVAGNDPGMCGETRRAFFLFFRCACGGDACADRVDAAGEKVPCVAQGRERERCFCTCVSELGIVRSFDQAKVCIYILTPEYSRSAIGNQSLSCRIKCSVVPS